MKLKLIALLSIMMLLFSCREDGTWDDIDSAFSFTIDRDTNFPEKSINEVNQLKFNVKPNYDFATVPMTISYTTSANGFLSKDGQALQPNTEYTLDKADNILSYTGIVAGTHVVKIKARNAKGATAEEEFELKYSVSEFSHTFSGGTAPIYQADPTTYVMKVQAAPGQPTTGYQIMFSQYSGTILYNGVPAQLGQWYSIQNIDNFSVTLATNVTGQGKLQYTIKNTTVSKDYEIQQTVLPRTIAIESANVSATNVLPNQQFNITGIVKKVPLTPNISVKYKTWISNASNGNVNGITNTQNAYIPYALGANGSFNIPLTAQVQGNYTYNIQFQDEFGNESGVQSFDIKVDAPITIAPGAGARVGLKMTLGGFPIQNKYTITNLWRTFSITAGGNSTISKVKYIVDAVKVNGGGTNVLGNVHFEIEENVGLNSATYQVQDQPLGSLVPTDITQFGVPHEIINGTVKIIATNSQGAITEVTVNAPIVVE